jgi:deaminated glutathione amidase
MKSELSVAVFQMTSTDRVDENLAQMIQLIAKLPESEVFDFLSFPENCLYMRLREGEVIQGFYLGDRAFSTLANLCVKRNFNIHLGSVPLHLDGGLYNASILITRKGDVTVSYKKIHLFDICLHGKLPIRESDIFKAGFESCVIEIDGWKIGQSICYDLRFSELFSLYAKIEVDLLLVPSAFLVETGRAHWEVLLRARAIESQCFLLASAQGGRHMNQFGDARETFGNSMIVGPWGDILSKLDSSPDVLVWRLKKSEIEKVRTQIPMIDHRKMGEIKCKT